MLRKLITFEAYASEIFGKSVCNTYCISFHIRAHEHDFTEPTYTDQFCVPCSAKAL